MGGIKYVKFKNLKSPYLPKIKSLPNIVINKNEENYYKLIFFTSISKNNNQSFV